MLVGRDRQRAAVDAAITQGQHGRSAALAFSGPPGIGKTALLGYATQRADGMALLRARGIESEAQIPFASLLELLRPALPLLSQLAAPQAAALEQAFALRPGRSQDRFAVAAATLGIARGLRGTAAADAGARRHPVVRCPELGGAAVRFAQARRRSARRDPRRALRSPLAARRHGDRDRRARGPERHRSPAAALRPARRSDAAAHRGDRREPARASAAGP